MKKSILDKSLARPRSDVSLSAFGFLFSELVQYSQTRVEQLQEWENRLAAIGYQVGIRMQELLPVRERAQKREIKLLNVLSWIHSTAWRILFGKQADSLEKSTERDDEYMIIENSLPVNKYISTPKGSGPNCAAFVAGIVEGILDGCDFSAEKVEAHSVPVDGQRLPKTVILVKFKPEVIAREKQTLA